MATSLTSTDLDSLLASYRGAGPQTATVYLPAPSAVEDADKRLDIRRKNVLFELDEAGVDSGLSERIDQMMRDLEHDDAPAHVLVATADDAVLQWATTRPISRVHVHIGPTPSLLPLLAATQVDVEHLAVLLDRTGADLLHRTGVADPIDHVDVEGPDVRIQRSHPGGWSQKRFQQTAENAWENNAREVVAHIEDSYPDIDVILCGGDERATGFFVDHLPSRFEVHRIDGSRHADPDAFLDAADVALRHRAAAETVELLDRWRSARAADGAVAGLDVLDMLTQGRVEHLLVVDDSAAKDRPRATFDFDVPARTHDGGSETPVTDGAVALAVETGAAVTVVPDHPDLTDGLAALLRF